MKKHNVVIEMSAGDTFKYEISKVSPNALELDRPLTVAVPQNYGFISGTLAADKDALDAFVISTKAIPHLTSISSESLLLLGAYVCQDNGELDEKLIFKVKGDNTVSTFVIENETVEIERYLRTYKQGFKVIKWVGPEEARKLIQKYAR